MPQTDNPQILSLDIGDRRVGVAIASANTKLARPLITLINDNKLIANIRDIIKENQVEILVVGLPRTLDGQDSDQTKKVRLVIEQLTRQLSVKIESQDEALSSVRAEEELSTHGKIFKKADIDKLAACFILEDYLEGN